MYDLMCYNTLKCIKKIKIVIELILVKVKKSKINRVNNHNK